MRKLYLGLGGNVGDTKHVLKQCIGYLSNAFGPPVEQSPLYKTAAWGKTDQPDFINQVLCFETGKSPVEVLNTIQETEVQMGRKRDAEKHWGPRKIDIDVLLFGSLVMETKKLQIPHPHMHRRNFVLVPFTEIAPGETHPQFHKPIAQLKRECEDTQKVERLKA